MALPFLLAPLPLPEALSLLNGSFFTAYPLSLDALDPGFSLPASVLIVQCLLTVSGAGLFLTGLRRKTSLLSAP